MSYTKLANSLLTSTLWMEDDQTRLVWVTMLAMADKNGEIQASIPGLANIARVSVDGCRVAIAKFLSPDLDSRTKTDEGRRIQEIRGGWALVNHAEYRQLASDEDRKAKSAERQRRYRDKVARNKPEPVGSCDSCGHVFEDPLGLYAVQDHNHQTGAVRGLICKPCNKVVGMIESGQGTASLKAELCRAYIDRWGQLQKVTPDSPSRGRRQIQKAEALASPQPERLPAPSSTLPGSPKVGWESFVTDPEPAPRRPGGF